MDKTKQTLAIALAAVLVVVAGGWLLLISPQRSSVASLQTQKSAVDTQNASLQLKIQQLKAEAVEEPADQEQLRAIARRLPSNLAEASLVATLSKAALAANVDLQVITPGAPTLVSAPAAAATVAAATTSAADGAAAAAPAAPATNPNQLYALPLSLTIQGNYFDLEMFIHNLEGMQRAMLISTLNLASNPGAAAALAAAAAAGGGATGKTTTNANTAHTSTGATGTSGTKSTAGKATSKATGKTAKPVAGTAAAAQAAAQGAPPFVVDANTLTLTLTGSVFSMYSSAPIPAAATLAPTPAPTK